METNVTFSGKIKVKNFRLQECWFDMAVHAGLDLAFKLQAAEHFEQSMNKSTKPLTLPLIAVPGIVTVGPAVQFGVGVDIKATAAVSAEAKMKLNFDDAKWHLDLVNSSRSVSPGFKPTYEASVKIKEKTPVQVNPYADLRFMLNAKILSLKDLNGGIRVAPRIANTFTTNTDRELTFPGNRTTQDEGQKSQNPDPVPLETDRPQSDRSQNDTPQSPSPTEGSRSGNREPTQPKTNKGSRPVPPKGDRPQSPSPTESSRSGNQKPAPPKINKGSKPTPPKSDRPKISRPASSNRPGNPKTAQPKGKKPNPIPPKPQNPRQSQNGRSKNSKPVQPNNRKGGAKAGKRQKRDSVRALISRAGETEEPANEKQDNGAGQPESASNCTDGLWLKSEMQIGIYAFVASNELELFQKNSTITDSCYAWPKN
ncbi:hypothetical protein CDD83_2969 [Cordyceps sp. RAO-2017]|nr:hypothetical protein CDD83_2969 [Cordyceps sp. RAO-2017]